jgi:hypothetical protein
MMPAKTVRDKTDNTIPEKTNPEYAHWVSHDQALLGYLLSSLTREVLQGVTMLPTSDEVWFALDDMYASHIQARLANTRIALCHKQERSLSNMAEYFNKVKCLADEMAASRKRLGDEEFIEYVLTGLDEEIYNSFVSSIVTRVKPISPSELYAQVLRCLATSYVWKNNLVAATLHILR